MSIILRHPLGSDWAAILEVANLSAPWADNTEWLERRKTFAGYLRHHYVAVETDLDRVIGYGAIEGEQTQGRFRIFVVTRPELLPTVGDQIYRQLDLDLSELNAEVAWAREESRDPLIDFFREHGIHETARFHHDEREIVIMEKTMHESTQEREL
jgi:hypothetical protein